MAVVKRTQKAMRNRAALILARLEAAYPEVCCTLNYRNPLHLMIMTILAAQCTDERVNRVTPALFARFPDAQAFANADVREIERIIHSCGFYRVKARNIKAACTLIVEQHGGKVPEEMAALVKLPGVGRKTANVIRGECFGAQGVIVDTHCTRLANRLGFTRQQDPAKIERELEKVWPPEHWTRMSHYMVWHGRAVCMARGPRCSECTLASLCPFPDSREGRKIAR